MALKSKMQKSGDDSGKDLLVLFLLERLMMGGELLFVKKFIVSEVEAPHDLSRLLEIAWALKLHLDVQEELV